jgi:L-phenylalanine/L-methionine N-acetyltransferase
MIRNITEADFSFVYSLYMHPSTNPFLLYETMPAEAFKPIFESLLSQQIIYVFSVNGLDVGMFKLIQLQHRSDHINYLGGVAIDPSQAGKGYGSAMVAGIIDLGRQRGLKRIELSTATTNARAIQLYEKHGFAFEGILRNYTHLKSENRYIDEQIMSYIYTD